MSPMFTVGSFHDHEVALASWWERGRDFLSLLVDLEQISLASVMLGIVKYPYPHSRNVGFVATSDFELPEATHDTAVLSITHPIQNEGDLRHGAWNVAKIAVNDILI